jgi:AGCS family alanine or glycine:cation symporter
VVALTQASLAGHVGEWGRVFVSVALMLFGFTTIIYNYYLGENSLAFFSDRNPLLIAVYRVVVIGLCGWGATTDLGTAFAFADVTMGFLALANLFALAMLFKRGLRLMRDFDEQIAAGVEEPVFDAAKFADLGIDPDAWKLEEEDAPRTVSVRVRTA